MVPEQENKRREQVQAVHKEQHDQEQDEENAERMRSRVNKFVELQEVPSPSNCPIFNGSGMCMCSSIACDDVKDFHCASMRYAFAYGYNTMAQRANEMIGLDNKNVTDLKDVITGQEEVASYFQATTNTCGFEDKARAALIALQEPRKTRKEVLLAIVSALGYTDVEVFKQTVESTNDTDDYFLGGMYRAVKAVEKLFGKDSDQE